MNKCFDYLPELSFGILILVVPKSSIICTHLVYQMWDLDQEKDYKTSNREGIDK